MFIPRKRRRRKAPSAAKAGLKLAMGMAKIATLGMAALAPAKPARKAKPPVAKPRKTVQSGSSFRVGNHRCAEGSLRYRIFTPPPPDNGKPMPLLIMLHGCAQTPEDFATGTGMNIHAQDRGVIVAYPGQTVDAHPNRCWNWFDPDQTMRGRGEAAILASLTLRILEEQNADPARVYVAGLSAGASMALVLAHAYPEVFAAVGVHSGLPLGAARDQTAALVSMQRGNPGTALARPIPTIVFHGSHDTVVHPRNGRLIAIRAREPFMALRQAQSAGQRPDGYAYLKTTDRIGAGRPLVEHWTIKGARHAWSGGSPRGRFTDAKGPDASHEMLRFFLRHSLSARARKSRQPT